MPKRQAEESFTPDDHAIVDRVPACLSHAVQLYRAWCAEHPANHTSDSLTLAQQPGISGSTSAFFTQLRADGAAVPIMGVHHELIRAGAGEQITAAAAREFLTRCVLRLAGSTDPRVWEFRYFYDHPRDGRLAKRPYSGRGDIPTLDQIRDGYRWVVLRIEHGTPSMFALPAAKTLGSAFTSSWYSWVAIGPEMIHLDEVDPRDGVVARHRFGMAMVAQPESGGFSVYDPCHSGSGFLSFSIELLEDGSLRWRGCRVERVPDELSRVPLSPVEWGTEALSRASGGLAAPWLAPVRDLARKLPFGDAAVDPVSTLDRFARALGVHAGAERLGLTRRAVLTEILAWHGRELSSFGAGVLLAGDPVLYDADGPSRASVIEAGTRPSWLDLFEYPFPPNYRQLDAGRMHYVDEGAEHQTTDGPGKDEVILISHGTPDWSFSYRYLIKKLSTAYRCVAVDHLGFGLSDKPWDFSYLPQDQAANFTEFAGGMQLDGITLVVNDWGGPFGLPLALEHTEKIRRLVIINTQMWSVEWWWYRLLSAVVGSSLGRVFIREDNGFTQFLLPNLIVGERSTTPRMLRNYTSITDTRDERKGQWTLPTQIVESGPWLDKQWAKIGRLQNLPTLIVWGMQDSVLRHGEYERWRKTFPQAVFQEVPTAKHYPHESHADEVYSAIRRFIEGSAQERSGSK